MFTSVKSMGLFGMHSYMVHVEIDVIHYKLHFGLNKNSLYSHYIYNA